MTLIVINRGKTKIPSLKEILQKSNEQKRSIQTEVREAANLGSKVNIMFATKDTMSKFNFNLIKDR